MNITVITSSIPSRSQWLAEARASVEAQTLAPVAHLVEVHEAEPGTPRMADVVATRNRLLAQVETEWVAVLDDDDLYDPDHFATIAPYLSAGTDVVTTDPHGHRFSNHVDLAAALEVSNLVVSNAAVRTQTLRMVGGWSVEGWDPQTYHYGTTAVWAEDWELWLRMARAGAVFTHINEPTWTYREDAPDRLTPAAVALMARRDTR